jgi:ATP-dependent DNA ligase
VRCPWAGLAVRAEAGRLPCPPGASPRRLRTPDQQEPEGPRPLVPELLEAARYLPPGTVLDGELVLADEAGHADFGGLQERLGLAARAVRAAAIARSAVLVAFDLLELAEDELLAEPLESRRRHLESLIRRPSSCLQLMIQTDDVQLARDWIGYVPSLEGVVAKRANGRYLPGRREWIKFKRHRTADYVVVGLAGDSTAPALVLALLTRTANCTT